MSASPAGPKEQVNIPTLLILIGAGGGLALDFMGMVLNLIKFNPLAHLPPGLIPPAEMERLAAMQTQDRGSPLLSILAMAVCGFLLYGALKMRNLQAYNVSLATCIVGLVPCCFTNCCCLAAMPGAIWGLVILLKPDVKAAFTG